MVSRQRLVVGLLFYTLGFAGLARPQSAVALKLEAQGHTAASAHTWAFALRHAAAWGAISLLTDKREVA